MFVFITTNHWDAGNRNIPIPVPDQISYFSVVHVADSEHGMNIFTHIIIRLTR